MVLPKERVRAVFDRVPVDRVPLHHIGFTSRAASHVLGREAYVGGGIQQWREACALWQGDDAHKEFLERSEKDAFDLNLAVGNDMVRMQYWRMPVRPARRIDECSFLYGDPDGEWRTYTFDPRTELYQITARHPEPVAEDLADVERQVIAEEDALESHEVRPEHFDGTRQAVAKWGREHVVRIAGGGIGIGHGSIAWLEAFALRPDLVARHFDVQAEGFVRSAQGLAEAGAEYVFGGGDMASNTGPIYSPQSFRELTVPRIKRMADACHQHGMRYLFASDGDLWPVADDLFGRCGVDGYFEIDRLAGMDLARLRERYPDLTLIGNISSRTLHRGTPEDVTAEARSCLEEADRSGGIIVGVSNYVMPETPPENIDALLTALGSR